MFLPHSFIICLCYIRINYEYISPPSSSPLSKFEFLEDRVYVLFVLPFTQGLRTGVAP